MAPRRTKGRSGGVKRFSVSLAADDYAALNSIASNHRPKLSLRYVVEYAIQQFLERAKDPAFRIRVGDPRTSKADV